MAARSLAGSWAVVICLPTLISTAQFTHLLPHTHYRHQSTPYDEGRVVEVWKAMVHLGAAPERASLLAPLIEEEARHYRLDPLVMVSIAHQESRFRLDARGPKGEVGLFQILPRVWEGELGITEAELWTPALNVRAGAHILAKYLRSYGDYALAVKAYNHRIYGAPYSKRVLSRYREIVALL